MERTSRPTKISLSKHDTLSRVNVLFRETGAKFNGGNCPSVELQTASNTKGNTSDYSKFIQMGVVDLYSDGEMMEASGVGHVYLHASLILVQTSNILAIAACPQSSTKHYLPWPCIQLNRLIPISI